MKKGISLKLGKRIASKIAIMPTSKDFSKDSRNSKDEIEKINAKDYSKDSSTLRDPSERAESSKVHNFAFSNKRPNYEVFYK